MTPNLSKGKPIFDVLIIWYLFLGGGGAGVATILSVLSLLSRKGRRGSSNKILSKVKRLPQNFFSVGYCVSFVVLVLSIFCLLVEISRPDRFYYVVFYPSFSIISIGAYVLAATTVCSGVLGLISLFGLNQKTPGILIVLEIGCFVLGAATMVYTGIFLMEFDFIVLWNNPLLPALFVCSACSVGAALLMLCVLIIDQTALRTPHLAVLVAVDTGVIILEIICLIGYCIVSAVLFTDVESTAYLSAFFFGVNAAEFWVGFVVCGLLIPLCLNLVNRKLKHTSLAAISISFVLVGGFFLRYCFVNGIFS